MKKIYYELNSSFRFFRKSNLDFPFHLHDDVEMVYCLKGSANAFCENKEYTIKQGDFFLAFPNQVHHYYNSTANGDYFVIILNPKLLGEFATAFLNRIPEDAVYHYDSSNPQDNMILPLLNSAWRDYTTDQAFGLLTAEITVIFAKLLKHYTLREHNLSDTTVSKIVQYCNEHYTDMISVDDICENLNVSRSYVSHLFHNKFKIGFCDYINLLRLNDAERLLNSTDDSVTSIALNCGFSTVRTFNRVFLKKYGVSPTAYRNDYINRISDSDRTRAKQDTAPY
ncbi:MAG: AraC family transcriptional regulator [Acutalibacteraceae bacterium]|nr:AraC family transcriptional regulator [Acutalibacteraceae bacterium]